MNRKLFRTLLCALLVCSMLAVPAFADSAVVTGSKVNVRSGPGTNYYAIISLERNTVVDIVNRYDDLWYEINYNGILGYVSSAYLSVSSSSSSPSGITVIEPSQTASSDIGSVILPNESSSSGISVIPDGSGSNVQITDSSGNTSTSGSSATNTATASTSGTKYYINAMYVRFRSGPGSSYSIIGEYNKGKEITVITTVGDWVAGYIDGLPGYVHKNYVTKGSLSSASTQTESASGITVVATPAATSSLPQPDGGVTVVTPSVTSAPAATAVALPSPAATSAASNGTNTGVNANGVKAYIVGTYVRLRTGPGTNYSIVGTYNTGKEVTAYANVSNGWLFCSVDGQEGYVHGNYVYVLPGQTAASASSSAAATPAPSQNVNITVATAQPVTSTNKTGYIIGNNVRFRAAASMTSQILDELFYGNQVTITGTTGDWAQVVYENNVGYVYAKYVREGTYASYDTADTTTSGTTVSSAATGQDIVNYAGRYLGYKYCWGGSSPETGFDCSGFVYYVFKHFGISINRVASDQASNGVHVDAANLRPGDILCFYSGSSYIGHVGIYIGNNKFIHSSNSTTGVIISELSGYYATRGFEARRLVG